MRDSGEGPRDMQNKGSRLIVRGKVCVVGFFVWVCALRTVGFGGCNEGPMFRLAR